MKKSLAIAVAVAVLIAVVLLLRPAGDRKALPVEGLPWQIETLPDGGSRVFGLVLAHSTIGDARVRFGEDMEIGLVAEHVVRKEYMHDTTYRYILDPDDLPLAWRAPIATITFIPAVSIDADTAIKRFGPPQERLRTSDRVEHFLYPDKGLDLVLDNNGKEILQYVAPREFARLREPLVHGASEKNRSGRD
jgi:hypothetical protein